MKTASRLLIASLASVGFVGTAVADTADEPAADGAAAEPAPDGAVPDPNAAPADPNAPAAPAAGSKPLMLAKGKILISGSTLNINLSTDAVAKPISIAPSIYYGVDDKLTAGITHSGGATSWTPRPALRSVSVTIPLPTGGTTTVSGAGGQGICVTGEDNGCGKVYNSVGLDALYALTAAKFAAAAHVGLDFPTFDPFVMSLRVGLFGKYAANDKLNVVFDPRIAIGITERDSGNKETLDIPVWIWYQLNPQLSAFVSTGINGPLDGFGDAFSIPVGLGAKYQANEKLGVGGDFFFLNLAGKNGGADARALGVFVDYAL